MNTKKELIEHYRDIINQNSDYIQQNRKELSKEQYDEIMVENDLMSQFIKNLENLEG